MGQSLFDGATADKQVLFRLPENSVDLSIVVPPFWGFGENHSNNKSIPLNDFKKIIKQVSEVTKPGGICCLVVTNDIHPETGRFIPITAKVLGVVEPYTDDLDWKLQEEVLWIRSTKSGAKSLNTMESIEMVSFDQIPFSHIRVLEKKGSKLEYKNRLDRLDELRVSDKKREEMSDSFWYCQPSSKSGYRDELPEEIAARLVMIYSDKNDFVLDPFAGDGVTGVVSKNLGRRFLCIVQKQKIPLVNERVKKSKNQN